MVAKSRWEEFEATGYPVPTVRKEAVIGACAPLSFFFLFSLRPQLMNRYCPQLRWIFLLPLAYSRESLLGLPEVNLSYLILTGMSREPT